MTSPQACVVSDTSPLSAMAKMGWLPWLRQRWGTVIVTSGVWGELSDIGDEAAWSALETARADGWLEVTAFPQIPAPPE